MTDILFSINRIKDLAADTRFPWNFSQWPKYPFGENNIGSIDSIKVCLTFDVEENYPDKSLTHVEDILRKINEILQKNHATGTFFVQGSIVPQIQKVLKTLVKNGHQLGLHGFNHNNWGTPVWFWEEKPLSISQRIADLEKSLAVFKEHSLPKPTCFRSPNMILDFTNLAILKDYGFKFDSSWPSYKEVGDGVQNIDGIVEIPISSVPDGINWHTIFPTYNFKVLNFQNVLNMSIDQIKNFIKKAAMIQKTNQPYLVFLSHPWEYTNNTTFKYCHEDNFEKLNAFLEFLSKEYTFKFLTLDQVIKPSSRNG